jgi:NAD(P)H-flavin reductase
MLPAAYRVVERRVETTDSVTLRLAPVGAALPACLPGQFLMLYAHGIGEIPISSSGAPQASDGITEHTVRDVGAVSRALHRAAPGDLVGARGPFGRGWPVGAAAGRTLVIVAGGVGLAPLRPVVLAVRAGHQDPAAHRRVVLVAGARMPAEFLFREELAMWSADPAMEVRLSVERPTAGWHGAVGFVTEPLARLRLDPAGTTAFLCGPEPMIRFSAQVLQHKGIPAADIHVSLERNMQCGVALCGHCQLGPLLLCRDGPVVDYAVAGPLLAVREL